MSKLPKAASLFFIKTEEDNYYNKHDIQNFQKVFQVFCYSLKKTNPDIPLQILNPPKDFIFNKKHSKKTQYWKNDNILKMLSWNEYVQNSDGNIILLDSDMMILKRLDRVFNLDFDIAYTSEGSIKIIGPTQSKQHINTGVIFIKNNNLVKKFFNEWTNICLKMYDDSKFWKEWKSKLYGLTQPSFLYVLEHLTELGLGDLKLLELPRYIYNADPTFVKKNNAKIIHLQNPFWKHLFDKDIKYIKKYYYNKWIEFYKEVESEHNNSVF